MEKVAVSELRAHLSKYLMQVIQGETVAITSHGKTIAELKKPGNSQENARSQLKEIAASAQIGDVVSPSIDELGAMH